MAGLASATRLAGRNHQVIVYEAAPRAGGRCRSFRDDYLERLVDNGNHLLLSANDAALTYLDSIGAADTLTGPTAPAFPFFDIETKTHWTLRPNDGVAPWWPLSPTRRVPDTNAVHYLSGLRLLTAGSGATVGDCIATDHPLFRSFWEPLTLAVMNMSPDRAAARPLRAVLLRTFARGGASCRPLVARAGLSPSFIDPALALLRQHGVQLQMSRRLRGLSFGYREAEALQFVGQLVPIADDDRIIVAVPPDAAAELLPNLPTPAEGAPIVNAHFRLRAPMTLPGGAPFLGLLGGTAHWLFVRGDIASVTVSSAHELVQRSNEELIPLLWQDSARALGISINGVPPARVIKEKRATFIQDPANNRRRPSATTPWRNVFVAGDWTDTGLPATIEGAISSGYAAADALEHSLERQAA